MNLDVFLIECWPIRQIYQVNEFHSTPGYNGLNKFFNIFFYILNFFTTLIISSD